MQKALSCFSIYPQGAEGQTGLSEQKGKQPSLFCRSGGGE